MYTVHTLSGGMRKVRSQRIQLKLSRELLEQIDEAANKNLNSRSGFIRESIVMRLNNQELTPVPSLDETLKILSKAGSNKIA